MIVTYKTNGDRRLLRQRGVRECMATGGRVLVLDKLCVVGRDVATRLSDGVGRPARYGLGAGHRE